MRTLISGSAGHLGEALVRSLRNDGAEAVGLDVKPSPWTDVVGSIADRDVVRRAMAGIQVVYHAATLHKPHVATHSRQAFVETNIEGTLVLLEEAVAAGVRSFVFTSTTSVFGEAARPAPGEPAAWLTEEVPPVPRNIYGVTKMAAEELCRLFHRQHGLDCIVLRTSRFFPEEDDDRSQRESYEDANLKANEMLFRRVDLEDVVSAHRLAAERASEIGFGRFLISATTPFETEDCAELSRDAPSVARRRVPGYEALYERLGWRMFPTIGRVYVNEAARRRLGWAPRRDFARVVGALAEGVDPWSPLTRAVGSKGYHDVAFEDGPYPVE